MRKRVGPELDFALLQILQHGSDENHQLKASELQKRCKKHYGISVSKDAIRDRLDSLVDWMERYRETDSKEWKPSLGTTVAKKKSGQSYVYYAVSHEQQDQPFELPEAEGEIEYAFVSLNDDEACPPTYPSQRRAAVGATRQDKSMPELEESLSVIQTAIDKRAPISALVELWHVITPAGGAAQVGPRRFALADKSTLRRVEQRIDRAWPYAIRFEEGTYYVVLSSRVPASERSLKNFNVQPVLDDLRVERVDRLRDVRLVDPEATPVVKPRSKRRFDGENRPSKELIDKLFDDSLYAMWHTRGAEEVVLRAHCHGLEQAIETFHSFDGFSISKEPEDIAKDTAEECRNEANGRKGRYAERDYWHTLRFLAHPVGVVKWALGYINDVEIIKPNWARKKICWLIEHNAYQPDKTHEILSEAIRHVVEDNSSQPAKSPEMNDASSERLRRSRMRSARNTITMP